MRLLTLSMQTIAPVAVILGMVLPHAALAQGGKDHSGQAPARIVVSGVVPDETSKRKLLAGVQSVYSDHLIVDQISVGGVHAPPDWVNNVEAVITPQLKSVSKGMLVVEGTAVSIRGEVGNEAERRGVSSQMSASLKQGYTLRNGLRVTSSGQALLDRTLDARVIEFENGSAMLTMSGMRILDEMADAMKKMPTSKIEVIGHTDSTGTPASNMALSRARAESVKTYLVRKGFASELISTSGMGSDQPVASNAAEEGRRKNRRIEFRAAK